MLEHYDTYPEDVQHQYTNMKKLLSVHQDEEKAVETMSERFSSFGTLKKLIQQQQDLLNKYRGDMLSVHQDEEKTAETMSERFSSSGTLQSLDEDFVINWVVESSDSTKADVTKSESDSDSDLDGPDSSSLSVDGLDCSSLSLTAMRLALFRTINR